jgi:hypothetical protein
MASLLASYPDDPKLGSPYNLNASDQDDRFVRLPTRCNSLSRR